MVCCCIVSLWFTGLEDEELGQGAPQPRVKPQLVCYRRSHRPFQSTGVWLSGSPPDSLYQHPSAPSSKCIKYFQHNTFSSSGWCLAWRREKIKMKSPKSQALLLPEFFFFPGFLFRAGVHPAHLPSELPKHDSPYRGQQRAGRMRLTRKGWRRWRVSPS